MQDLNISSSQESFSEELSQNSSQLDFSSEEVHALLTFESIQVREGDL